MPKRGFDLIIDPNNEVYGSAVAIWEVAIKHAKRRREGRDAIVSGAVLLDRLTAAGLELLPITAAHAATLDTLPLHHADPFDRLLVAQAKAEPMKLLTVDKALAAYGDNILLV